MSLRHCDRVDLQIYDGPWSVENGIRCRNSSFLYREDEIVEHVKLKLFSEEGFGRRSGVTITRVKKQINPSRSRIRSEMMGMLRALRGDQRFWIDR